MLFAADCFGIRAWRMFESMSSCDGLFGGVAILKGARYLASGCYS